MRGDVAIDANVRHRPALMREIEKQGIVVHTNCAGKQVTGEGVLCFDASAGEEALVPGETVICAVGQRSNRDAVMALRTCAPWDVADSFLNCAPVVRQIGDCVRPSNITNAVYQGYHAALDI